MTAPRLRHCDTIILSQDDPIASRCKHPDLMRGQVTQESHVAAVGGGLASLTRLAATSGRAESPPPAALWGIIGKKEIIILMASPVVAKTGVNKSRLAVKKIFCPDTHLIFAIFEISVRSGVALSVLSMLKPDVDPFLAPQPGGSELHNSPKSPVPIRASLGIKPSPPQVSNLHQDLRAIGDVMR